MSRHCFAATFSSSVRLARNLTGQPIAPREVTLTWPEPESRAEYGTIRRNSAGGNPAKPC